jgi:lipocalin
MKENGLRLVKFRPKEVINFHFHLIFKSYTVHSGAFFEKDCVCTELNIAITNSTNGDGLADNDCRYKEIDGRWNNVTGSLYNEDLNVPGRWLESINGNSVNYTVIAIGEDFAVEYDCGTGTGTSGVLTYYCVHVMSRSRTMDDAQFDELMQMAEDMGLNPQALPITKTTQDDAC